MNNKSKILFISLLSALLVSPVIAQTQAPKLIGGVTMLPSTVNDGNVEISNIGGADGMVMDIGVDSEDFFNEATTNVNGTKIQKETSRADRLRGMETDFLPQAKNVSGIGGSQEDNANFDAMGSTDLKTGEKQEKAPAKKVIKVQKKKPVIVSTVSSFNTQTIQYIETQARERDAATYQEFLRENSKK